MVTRIAEWVYNASLAELRKGSAGNKRRSKLLRKARRLLLKLADPDIFARLDGFLFRTPFSSNIILYHFESPLYDSALPRLAWAVSAARGGLMMVDVGANVGAATYLVSQETTGRFFCIEPNPRFKASLTPDVLFNLLRRYGYVHFIFYDGGGNLLTSLTGGQSDQIQSLRRYCELRHAFFDVAAFHASDFAWSHEFERCEKDFFERTLHPLLAQSPP